MDFDELLATLRYNKRWHKTQFLLIIAINILVMQHMLATVFYQAIPDHRCRLPSEDSSAKFKLSKEEMDSNYPEDKQSTTKYSQCEMYKNGNQSNKVKCEHVVFDDTIYTETAATNFEMVCSKKYLLSTCDSVSNVGFMIGSFVNGWFADRFGRKPVVCINLITQLLSGLVIMFSPWYAFYVICGRLINGISTAGVCITGFVLALEMVYPKHRLYATLLLQGANATGTMLVALYAYLFRNYKWNYGLVCAPGIVFCFFWFFLLESPRWQITSNHLAAARKNIVRIAKWNKVDLSKAKEQGQFDIIGWLDQRIASNVIEQAASVNKVNIFKLFKYRRLLYRLVVFSFIWITIVLSFYGMTYFNNFLFGSDFLNYFLASCVEALSYVFVLFTLNVWGRRILFSLSIISSGILLIIATFIPIELGWLCTTMFMISKCVVAYTGSVVYIYTAELFPTVIRNSAMGFCSTIARIGSISAPYILLTVDIWRPCPMFIMGVGMFISGLLCATLPETLNKKLADTLEEGENFGKKPKPVE